MHSYEKVSVDELMSEGDNFCKEYGDPPYGLIPEFEFDGFYNHLAENLAKHGSFSEEIGEAFDVDFSGCRTAGDPHPVVGIVPRDGLEPYVALIAGLEAVKDPPRPLAIQFDFYPDYLLVCSSGKVFGTFDEVLVARESRS